MVISQINDLAVSKQKIDRHEWVSNQASKSNPNPNLSLTLTLL